MRIIIVGCGKVGATLAAQLNAEGNNVTVIDQDATKVKAIANKLDIMGVIGNGASRTTQKEAGVDRTDLLIAVTGNDELNLLSCLVAKKSSNCRTIARLRNPEYNITYLTLLVKICLVVFLMRQMSARLLKELKLKKFRRCFRKCVSVQ